MIVVSIDPGLTGAVAVLDRLMLRAVFDLPTMPIPGVGPEAKVQKKVDGRALRQQILATCPPDEPIAAVIEAVGVMPSDRKKNAIQFQGSLMRSLGAVETVIETLRLPVAYSNTRTWKKFYGLIDPKWSDTQRKAAALAKARALYPSCEDLARAKDHNRAEAVLIGHHYLRTAT